MIHPRVRTLYYVMLKACAGCLLCVCAVVCGSCTTDQRSDVMLYRSISDPPASSLMFAAGQSLSLTKAMSLTAYYNEQLAISGERYIQILARRQQLASVLRPTLEFFADADLRENTAQRSVASTDVGLRGQYRLLTGMSDLRNVDAADADVTSQKWLILDLREALLVQVSRAYYESLRAQRVTAVLNNTLTAQLARLDDARARNEVGFARPLDVAQIEAQVSRTRTQIITSARAEQESRSLLTLLCAAPVESSELTDGFMPPSTASNNEDLVTFASENRADILAALAAVDSARNTVDSRIGQYAPAITLNLDYFLLRSGDNDVSSDITSLLSLRLPLFSAGRIAAEVREAWSIFRERVLTYQLTVREARSDVEIAQARLTEANELLSELNLQVKVAQQTVDLAEASYNAGLGTNLERVVAQDQLLAAQLETVVAEFSVKIAYIELLRACGRLSSELLEVPIPKPTPNTLPPTSPFLDRTSNVINNTQTPENR